MESERKVTAQEFRDWLVNKVWRSQKQLDSIMEAWGFEREELFDLRACFEVRE